MSSFFNIPKLRIYFVNSGEIVIFFLCLNRTRSKPCNQYNLTWTKVVKKNEIQHTFLHFQFISTLRGRKGDKCQTSFFVWKRPYFYYISGSCSVENKGVTETDDPITPGINTALLDVYYISCQGWMDPNRHNIIKYVFKSKQFIYCKLSASTLYQKNNQADKKTKFYEGHYCWMEFLRYKESIL